MKTTHNQSVSRSVGGSRRLNLAVLTACAALLLVSIRPAHGNTGWVLGATNAWNYFDANGATGLTDGTDPVAPLSGSQGYVSYPLPITPFSGSIPASTAETVYSTVITGPNGLGGSSPYAYASFWLGNTPNGANPTGYGGSIYYLTLFINNVNSAPDEVRLDWFVMYNYTGSTSTTLGNVPLSLIISGYGSGGGYYALAGGESMYDLNNGQPTITATIGAGTAPGDGFTHDGLGSGPWNGALLTPPNYYFGTPTAPFSGTLTIDSGESLLVYGYLDLVVDPGTVTIQMGILQPPALGITTYSNYPVVFYPTIPGTNFVLQTSSSLTGTNWVPVTNGIPISGFIITNATSPAFYQLN